MSYSVAHAGTYLGREGVERAQREHEQGRELPGNHNGYFKQSMK